jgi:hypothetical protein
LEDEGRLSDLSLAKHRDGNFFLMAAVLRRQFWRN